MLVVAALIGALFVVISVLCYVKRFLFFRGLNLPGRFPWPIIMDAIHFRDSEKVVERIINGPKKYGWIGGKVSVGFEGLVLLYQNNEINHVLNSLELISKGTDYKFLEPWLGLGLLLSTGKKWTQRRKLLTPTFHFSILKDFVPTFEAIGDAFIEVLEQKLSKGPFDVFPVISLYTLDVICETSMGISIDAQRNENHEYVVAVKKLANLFVRRGLSPWKRFAFLYQFSSEYKEYNSLCDLVHKHTDNIIEQRRQKLTDFDDDLIDRNGIRRRIAFLDMLIKSTIDGRPLSNEDIREEVDTFMFEGHDTTSSALSFSLYCLSQHPEIQVRLLKEQREVLGEAVHASYEDLQKMDYLEMVIKEVLRLYPPVPLFARDVKENINIEHGTLRAGVQVHIIPMVTHRNPEYFPDPEKFDPERFSAENIKNIKPFTYIPFSGGYRNCIGQRFAMLSLKSALSKIVRNFKILPDPTYTPKLTFEMILKSANGVWVIIEKRL